MQINYNFSTDMNSNSDSFKIAIIPEYKINLISDKHMFLTNLNTQKSIILEQSLINIIEELKIFRLESEHINNIMKHSGLTSSNGEISNIISSLKDLGFIITSEDACKQNKSENNLIEEQPIVVVRTANRVSMLNRFIKSAVENETIFNARYEYLFIDDSNDELAAVNAENIKKSNLNAKHIDKSSQQGLIDELKYNFPNSASQIDFLLGDSDLHNLGITYGKTWNWGVLLSAGKPVVFLDDDCLLKAYEPAINPDKDKSLTFASSNKDVKFLSKDIEISEQLQRIKIDPISSLASSLGLGCHGLPINNNSFVGASSDILNKLDKSNVIMVTQGVAGDPGASSLKWLYHLSEESTKNFISTSEELYNKNKVSRFTWCGYPQIKVGFDDTFSMVARAFDNRKILPATIPIFRNEDALFSSLTSFLYPNALSFEHSWAIEHLPETERKWDDSSLDVADNFDLSAAMSVIMKSISNNSLNNDDGSESVNYRLHIFANELISLTNKSDEDFNKWMYSEQQSFRSANLSGLHKALDDYPNAPEYWKNDIIRQITANTSTDQQLKSEISPNNVKLVIANYAKSLKVWTSLWDYCEKLEF